MRTHVVTRGALATSVPGLIVLGLVVAALSCGHPPVRTPPLATTRDAGVPDQARGSGRCTPWVPNGDAGAEISSASAATETAETGEPEDTGRRAKPFKSTDLCETADSNLALAEAKILADAGGAKAAHVAWDHKTKPERFDLVARRLSLGKPERDLLSKNGFVVQSRNTFSTYAWALHEVYQSQLPIYVSADAILHAVYTSNDHLLADIERGTLVPLLGRTLSAMHCALAEAAAAHAYPPDVARDLDLYLTVARSLLADAPIASVLGTDAEAAKLLAAAHNATGIDKLEIFGRERVVDWSQYQPRGHYADPKAPNANAGGDAAADDPSPPPNDAGDEPSLAPYFRAGMWLSRLEFNLVSRSSRSSLLGSPDPRETPREAVVAIALSDVAVRGNVADDVARLDRAWALLAGKREDVSIADMALLRKKAAIGSTELSDPRATSATSATFDKLKAAIGNDFQRTARLHPMPEGSTVLPAIATFLGPRVVADTAAFRPLVHTEVAERYLIGSGDVAYVLGLDRGKTYLKEDLAAHPELGAKLDQARGIIAASKDAGDLYGAWLGALRGVADKPVGVVPSFMQTTAYDDLRMNTIIAGYGQIRHNYVLMAGQSYDEGGCVIPDGWVEPMTSVYEGIAKYAARGALVMKELDPKDTVWTSGYWKNLEKVSRVLATISRHELEGRALSTEEKRFLSMVVEMIPGGTGGPPQYTGWYFDLFRGRSTEGLASASFVADYHTSSWKGKVVYAGAMSPAMGIFVIDAGGPPRLAVGPVAHAFEAQSSIDKRYDDHSAIAANDRKEPWSASYTAGAPPEPKIAAAIAFYDEGKDTRIVLRTGSAALSNVVVEILDHHRVPITTATRTIPANGKVVLKIKPGRAAEGVRIRVGEYTAERMIHGPESAGSIERGGVTIDSNDYAEDSK